MTVTRWWSALDTDILIAAGQNYKGKVIPLPDGQIDIYYTQLPEEFIDREGGEIAAAMTVFTQGLGSTTIPSGAIKLVFSPKRKGQGRAGIARPGMVVTSEGLMLEALAKSLSHGRCRIPMSSSAAESRVDNGPVRSLRVVQLCWALVMCYYSCRRKVLPWN